ncbi:MAG: shikimate dehydrogenase [Flavobacteriales bacterium]
MRNFGLIGKNLKHSFSEKYFSEKFKSGGITDVNYSLFELSEISELKALMLSLGNLEGFNVTIPYKEQIIPLLDGLSPEAKEIKAVNTVKIINGKLIGYNTDAVGFKKSLAAVFKPHHERALILGSGGASKAIGYTLGHLGVDYKMISRRPVGDELGYHDLNKYVVKHFPLIINTTPLGTFPEVDKYPDIPYEYLTPLNLLYDLVYNPEQSLFLKKGEERGADTLNGYRMLVLQAEESWEIWNK